MADRSYPVAAATGRPSRASVSSSASRSRVAGAAELARCAQVQRAAELPVGDRVLDRPALEHAGVQEPDRERVARAGGVDDRQGQVRRREDIDAVGRRGRHAEPAAAADHQGAAAQFDQPLEHVGRVVVVGGRHEQHVGRLDEVTEVLVVRVVDVLQIARDDGARLAGEWQQRPRPVRQMEEHDARAPHQLRGEIEIHVELLACPAVVEGEPGAVLAHQVDAARRSGRIDAEGSQVDPVSGEFGAHLFARGVRADMADERRRVAQRGEPATAVAPGLPHVIDVLRDVALAGEIERHRQGKGQEDAGVDAGGADHDDVTRGNRSHHQTQSAGRRQCQRFPCQHCDKFRTASVQRTLAPHGAQEFDDRWIGGERPVATRSTGKQADETRDGVGLTHLDRELFDESDVTKRELVDYLDAVRDRILPVLRGRPLSVVRVRPGQPSFMQKNLPKYTPDWVQRTTIWAEASRREVSYALCEDRRTLLWLANQRAVEYHPTLVFGDAVPDRPDPPHPGPRSAKALTSRWWWPGPARRAGAHVAARRGGEDERRERPACLRPNPASTAPTPRRPSARSPRGRRGSTRASRPRRPGGGTEHKVFEDSNRGWCEGRRRVQPRVRPDVPVPLRRGGTGGAGALRDFTVRKAVALLGDGDPWREAMPRPRRCRRTSSPRVTVSRSPASSPIHQGQAAKAQVRQLIPPRWLPRHRVRQSGAHPVPCPRSVAMPFLTHPGRRRTRS